ncbi:MAG TPA: hypothetical protein VMG80_04575 [Solirubrobacteraceae bacterium]|nr:hypothetical protein [Solirubrobacteraceae bacterium]
MRRIVWALATILAASAWLAQPALSADSASTSASIAPSLSPNRIGAKAALTFRIHYSSGDLGVPAPVRRSILRFPKGLGLEIPVLRSCSAARLRAEGPSGCPAQSWLGGGHALLEARAGTEDIAETATLWAFLGPPQNLSATVEIFAHAYTPLDQEEVISGEVLPAEPPYGEELVMSVPPIPTLVFEPEASVVSFSLTIGSGADRGAHSNDTVRLPSRCPSGGFPFSAEFTYADGSTGTAAAQSPCPR